MTVESEDSVRERTPVDGERQEFFDEPGRDFRQRYLEPEHFCFDRGSLVATEYEGFVQAALSLLPEPPRRVLDVGCGDGWVARRLIEKGFEVLGIDYSARAIGFAKALVSEGEFERVDARALVRQSRWRGEFGAALLIEVLEHVPPMYHGIVLRGIGTCLPPGGILVMSVPSLHRRLNPWHYKHFDRDEAEGLLEENGFLVEKVLNVGAKTLLRSPILWRCLRNRLYDMSALRVLVGKLLLARFNLTDDPRKADRYVFQATVRDPR